jgi:hypothetical protein
MLIDIAVSEDRPMKKLIPLFIIALAAAAFAQSELPDRGSLSDIKGKTKFYIVADAQNTKQILKALKDHSELVQVNRADDADFFIEYAEPHERKLVTSAQLSMISGQLDVYFYRDKRKVVAWSDSKESALQWPSLSLTKKFLKDFLGK